jgi:hypothetical protein
MSYPTVASSQLLEDIAGKPITAFADTLPKEATEAAKDRGRSFDLEVTVSEVLDEI